MYVSSATWNSSTTQRLNTTHTSGPTSTIVSTTDSLRKRNFKESESEIQTSGM